MYNDNYNYNYKLYNNYQKIIVIGHCSDQY